MRLIDADKIEYEPMLSARGNGQYEDVMVAYKDQIDDMPTIEERKTGKWIQRQGMYEIGYKCSECDAFSLMETSYCAKCGAKMEGKQP